MPSLLPSKSPHETYSIKNWHAWNSLLFLHICEHITASTTIFNYIWTQFQKPLPPFSFGKNYDAAGRIRRCASCQYHPIPIILPFLRYLNLNFWRWEILKCSLCPAGFKTHLKRYENSYQKTHSSFFNAILNFKNKKQKIDV